MLDIRIQEAFDEIHKYLPRVNIVLFLPDGTWRYFDTDGETPGFPNALNVSLLEAANDSVNSVPSVFIDERVSYD